MVSSAVLFTTKKIWLIYEYKTTLLKTAWQSLGIVIVRLVDSVIVRYCFVTVFAVIFMDTKSMCAIPDSYGYFCYQPFTFVRKALT